MSDDDGGTYWAFWHNVSGRDGFRRGPFRHYQDAVRHIEADMHRWAVGYERVTGAEGWWKWDTDLQAATLYPGGLQDMLATGYYLIEQAAPAAETDDDDTNPVESAALRSASRFDTIIRTARFDLFLYPAWTGRYALAMRTTMSDATRTLREAVARWDDDRSWEALLEEHDGAMTHVWNWNKQTASWEPSRTDDDDTDHI